MGSFQQVIMGGTCLAAVFFFGNYLHNRPASNDQGQHAQIATDPLDAIFSFGKKSETKTGIEAPVFVTPQVQVATPQLASPQLAPQFAAVPVSSGIDPSERAQVVDMYGEHVQQQVVQQPAAAAVNRKPIVPDFSELAARFRNTPLELTGPSPTSRTTNGVHASERVPFTGQFEAPKLVVRQPENTQPLQAFRGEVDRIEESVLGEFSAVEPEPNRWRVNRSQAIDEFQAEDQFQSTQQMPRQNFQRPEQTFQRAEQTFRRPQQRFQPPQQDFARDDFEQRETIEDVLSRRSADYLKDESDRETWATDPPTESWTSKRNRVTEQAANRSRGRSILDIEDPGNRFRSDVEYQPHEISPPEPDFETAYYTPTKQRQDAVPPPASRPNRQMRSIESNVTSNISRRSNIQSQFSDRYEIQPGDTLQSISTRFYGSADYYLEIYKANRAVLDRITSSPVGVRIEIPDLNN